MRILGISLVLQLALLSQVLASTVGPPVPKANKQSGSHDTSLIRTREQEQTQVFVSQQPSSKHIVLIHGLNNRPSSLNSLRDIFLNLGFNVTRVGLAGHSPPFDTKQSYTREWKDQIDAICSQLEDTLQESSQKNKHPKKSGSNLHQTTSIWLAGYSTGGLLGADAQVRGSCNFKGFIFFAPAIKIRGYTHLVKLSFPFFTKYPSRAPKAYRAVPDGTPKSLYRSFFALYSDFQSHRTYQALAKPALIFMNPHDELISKGKIRNLIKNYNLPWRFHLLKKSGAQISHINHLIIDEFSLPPKEWKAMQQAIKQFFKKN